jgi:aromatic-L-amino-acid/L-tryptophan decarboxylase
MPAERAEIANLQRLLSLVGTGLDQYLKFEHPDSLHNNRWRESLDIPLPQQGVGIDQVTQELISEIIPNGSPVPKPGFSSFITTGSTTASTLASTAASIASPQRYMHTAFNFLEELSLRWLAEMCGLGNMQGIYSSGGSVANLIALGGARQSSFEKIGHDPAADGINKPVSVYASSECHHTVQRSGGVLGIGRRSIKLIACDNKGRMRVDDLQQAIAEDKAAGILPMAIVATAGTTNTGAIDPLQKIGEIAAENSIWFHIDGAYGLPGILDKQVSHLYQGLELADSAIIDPHKWLGASVGVAATFVRDRQILYRAFTQEPADYLEGSVEQGDNSNSVIEHSLDDFGIPYFDYGVELSAPCRGVVVWALLREIGVEGIRERIIRHNDMARHISKFASLHPNLEVLCEPTLSICCFRYVTSNSIDLDRFNQILHRRLVRENEYMPSTTRVNGKLALRPCYIGARANHGEVVGLLDSVLRIGKVLEAEL